MPWDGGAPVSVSVCVCVWLRQVAFNISANTVGSRVNYSNAYWGGDAPAGSRILFPNGQIDPWHYLGVLQAPNPMEPVSRPPLSPFCDRLLFTCPEMSCPATDTVGAWRVTPLLDAPLSAHGQCGGGGGTQGHLDTSHRLAAGAEGEGILV